MVAAGTLGNVRMVRSWWLNNDLDCSRRRPSSMGRSIGSSGRGRRASTRPIPTASATGGCIPITPAALVADQGAHVFDGIHLLMNAGYPLAVNASGGKVHQAGGDTPESVVAIAEYPEDFLGVFTINYAAMQYKLPQRPVEPARRRQGAHGHRPRGVQGLHARGGRDGGDLEEVGKRIRLRDRPARAEFPGVRAHAQDADRADASGVPGGAGGPDGEPIDEARAQDTVESREE